MVMFEKFRSFSKIFKIKLINKIFYLDSPNTQAAAQTTTTTTQTTLTPSIPSSPVIVVPVRPAETLQSYIRQSASPVAAGFVTKRKSSSDSSDGNIWKILKFFETFQNKLVINFIFFILDNIVNKRIKIDKILQYVIEIKDNQKKMNDKINKIEKKIEKIQKKVAEEDTDEEVNNEAFIKVGFFWFFLQFILILIITYINLNYFQKQEFCQKNFGTFH